MRLVIASLQGGANGIETYTRILAAALARRGHEPTLAARSRETADAVGPLPPHRWRLRQIIGPFESRGCRQSLRTLAADVEASVIHATYPEFTFSDRPTVVTAWHPSVGVAERLRMSRQHGERGILGPTLFALNDERAYRTANACVAVTPSVQRALGRAGASSRWIPAFVEDDQVLPTLTDRDRTCVMVARWLDEPRKGLPTALSAVAEARRRDRRVRLILVGGWRDPTLPARLPDFCTATGVLERPAVLTLLRTAGCCLMPSHWEEFGYAAIEALAAGVPIIVGPLPLFEGTHTDGLLIADRRQPTTWANSILTALTVTDFVYPTSFRASRAIPQLVKLYEQATGGRLTTHR